jgi:transposase
MRVYVVKKWPLRERRRFVLEYHTSKSVVTVQRAFRAKYANDPPTDKTIRAWYKQFAKTGSLCKQKSSGRPLTAEDDAEQVRASFLHSPKKTGTAAKELSMSKTTVWKVVRKRLVFKPYRIQMVQQLSDEDHRRRLDFCLQLQDLMSSGDHFQEKVQFSDEATFHVSGAVNLAMTEYGDLKTHMLMWRIYMTLLKSMLFAQSPVKKCTVHSSLLKKPLQA